MKRLLIVLAVGSLALPATALAKGPTKATLEGPGTEALTFNRYDSPGINLTHITEHAGFMEAVFGSTFSGRILPGRPKGDLGPRYTITYEVGPEHVVLQDVYPYAKPDAVSYTRPGQQVFGGETSRGGWFRAGPQLKETLIAAGLPAAPPASESASDGFSIPMVGASLLLLLAMSLVAATALFLRRSPRKEPVT